MSYAELAKKYNVAYSSIIGIVKQKNLILSKSMHKSTHKLCREQNPKFGSLKEKLFDEFTRVKASDKTVVTDNWLKSRAQKLAPEANRHYVTGDKEELPLTNYL